VLFCYVLFCYMLFCYVLFCYVLFCYVLFCYMLFCYVLFCYVLFCSDLLINHGVISAYVPVHRVKICACFRVTTTVNLSVSDTINRLRNSTLPQAIGNLETLERPPCL